MELSNAVDVSGRKIFYGFCLHNFAYFYANSISELIMIYEEDSAINYFTVYIDN